MYDRTMAESQVIPNVTSARTRRTPHGAFSRAAESPNFPEAPLSPATATDRVTSLLPLVLIRLDSAYRSDDRKMEAPLNVEACRTNFGLHGESRTSRGRQPSRRPASTHRQSWVQQT